jgi:hypothetical protein
MEHKFSIHKQILRQKKFGKIPRVASGPPDGFSPARAVRPVATDRGERKETLHISNIVAA